MSKKTPQIRFKGFTDDWAERKLGDFVIDYVEKTTTQNQFPVLTSSQQQGIVLQETYFANRQVTTDNNIGYYVLPRGYFTFRNRSDNDVFIFNRNDLIDKGIISYFYPVFTLKNSDSDFFLKRINNGIKRQVSIQAEGTGQHVLSMKKFKNIISMFPSLEEQEKIGSFFKQLDNTIALHQRKLDLLKEQKKGFLQKMFPKNGAKVPELRFEGFSDDWEERKFSNLAEVRRGLTYKPSDVQKYGIRVLRSSNIAEDTFLIKSDDVFVNKEAVKIDKVKNGDILITSANGSSRLVGKHALIEGIENDTVHGGFMLVARAEKPEFVNAIMSSSWYSKFINIFVSGGNGAIGNLSKSDLEDQKVYVPSEIEQTKIGLFFKGLDDTIALHQRKLDLLKEQKKGFLQKMFVS
ncbi:restriction endonuclease subunit S [Leuconostoc mesenteroides]|uniref:restriction endonuclease subunit S n=1 Tax=Leuconostoc mesenteroides TaxID=1245 RepID=UPI00235F7563|nr:restriction endonuclease subunit S [Leuconostoc mesenteroides]